MTLRSNNSSAQSPNSCHTGAQQAVRAQPGNDGTLGPQPEPDNPASPLHPCDSSQDMHLVYPTVTLREAVAPQEPAIDCTPNDTMHNQVIPRWMYKADNIA